MSGKSQVGEEIFVISVLRQNLHFQIFFFLFVLPGMWSDIRCWLTVHLDLYIWMAVCLWQMAPVSHLYSCLFTNEMVSNVLQCSI